METTLEEARAFMGLMKKDHIRGMCNTPSVIEKWQARHGRTPDESDVDLMYADTEPMMVAILNRFADPVPGLLETMEIFRAMGIKIGSSTGYTGPMMDVLVPEAAKQGYSPDSIVCSSDVPAGRPYPWMCCQNALNLQVFPMEAMVKIGDTINDIQEGLNAGMWTIGLSRSGNELGLSKEEADKLPANVLEEKLRTIEKRFLDAGAHFTAQDISQCPKIILEINDRLSQGALPLA